MIVNHQPSPALARYVEALWYYDGYRTAQHQERVLPTGKFQVVIDLAGAPGVVTGLRSKYLVIDTSSIQSVMGIVFRSGGAGPFFDVPVSDFYNQVVPLDLVWGSTAGRLCERLHEAPTVKGKLCILEAMLLEALGQAKKKRLGLHASVQYALGKFGNTPNIQTVFEVTKEAGLSRRRFNDLFRDQVGITPKLYCRLRRFFAVIRQVASGESVDWADVAVAGGYCDQAHLTHEFQEFSGLSPARYLAAERPFLNHIRVE